MISRSKIETKNVNDTKVDSKIPKRDSSKSRQQRKSPARSTEKRKSPARKKSPSRNEVKKSKSPNRTTRKSPSRQKSKSPVRSTRRSPSRKMTPVKSSKTPELVVEITRTNTDKVQRERRALVIDSDSDDLDAVQDIQLRSRRSYSRGHSKSKEKEMEIKKKSESNNYSGITRRITTHNRVEHNYNTYDILAKKLTELSDDDDTLQTQKKGLREKLLYKEQPVEFGGWIGTSLLTFLLPVITILTSMLCHKFQCTFTKLPVLDNYKKLSVFFDLTTFGILGVYMIFLAILSALPFGGKKVSSLPGRQEKFEYRMNGLFCCIVTFITLFSLEFLQFPIFSYIIDHYFHFLTSATVYGILLSIYVYIRSFYVHTSALNLHVSNSTSVIYGFFMGRELNPRFFGLIDLKLYNVRFAVLACMILYTAFFYESLHFSLNLLDIKSISDLNKLNVNPTLLVLYLTQAVYNLHIFFIESTLLSTFETRYEGCGFMSCFGFIQFYPFMNSAIIKYVFDYDIQLKYWQLAVCISVFLIGFIMNIGSDIQKDKFRKNPYSPEVAHLESLPTSQGSKLLISGFWGFVRHPNYLGEIIMYLSWLPFVGFVPAALLIFSTLFGLIYRTHRDHVRCKQRYGTAWDRYCQKVKYVLIPKVY